MIISYDPLWKTMKQKKITQYQLIHSYGFDNHTLQSLRDNRNITLHTLGRLCELLDCTPNDVVTFQK